MRLGPYSLGRFLGGPCTGSSTLKRAISAARVAGQSGGGLNSCARSAARSAARRAAGSAARSAPASAASSAAVGAGLYTAATAANAADRAGVLDLTLAGSHPLYLTLSAFISPTLACLTLCSHSHHSPCVLAMNRFLICSDRYTLICWAHTTSL